MKPEYPLGVTGIATPDGWDLTTIGAVCDENDGEVQTGPFGSQLHASDYEEVGTPVVMPQDLVDGTVSTEHVARVNVSHVDRLHKHRLTPGDVIYSRRGDVTRFAIATEVESGWLCGTGCMRIRLGSPMLDASYLRQYLAHSSVKNWLVRQAKGATMPNLNTNILRALPLLVPPLPEQRRIAAILDKADAIRRKRQKAIELTEQFLKSAFMEMFGDPVTNPKGWERIQLKKLIRQGDKINYGVVQPGLDVDDGVPIVRVGDFSGFGVDRSSLKRISPTIEAEYKRSRLTGDEVLVACVGSIGLAILVDESLKGANIVRAVARIRCGEQINRLFLCSLLRTPAVQAYFAKETRTVSQPTLNIKQIEETPIIVPPITRQLDFAALFTKLQATSKRLDEHDTQLDQLFESLVQRAFRGELSEVEVVT